MNELRRDDLSGAYDRLCRDLEAALYEEDPAAMGAKIAAPRDEYSAEAARLAVLVKDVSSRSRLKDLLYEMFHVAPDGLIDRVERALSAFRAATGR